MKPTSNELMRARLLELLQPLKVPAYRAVLSLGERDDPCASKFGGSPYMEAPALWPACEKCNQPFSFICQLNLQHCSETQLPAGRSGLVSFFYCWQCCPFETKQQGWRLENYSDARREKHVPVSVPNQPKHSKQSWLSKFIAPKVKAAKPCLVSFSQFESVPDLDEFETLIPASVKQEIAGDDVVDLYCELRAEITGISDDYSTQVGGYASWIQSRPELSCNQCGGSLKLLMQVGSEENAGISFGDAGAVYFCYCSEHPDSVRMVLQCF